MSTPSVLLHHPQHQDIPTSFDGFGSTYPAMGLGEGPSSPGRRQRISMACQYCRHRKIRCCGGAPCRNCTRAKRECEYAPVPEEVNRATREKKAIAKAAKATHFVSPVTTSSPYFPDQPVYNVSYVAGPGPIRPAHLGHRRTVSMPTSGVAPWVPPPPAPALASPPMFESPQWMYSGWNGAGPVPAAAPVPAPQAVPTNMMHQPPPPRTFPSVLEETPMHHAYLNNQAEMLYQTPGTPAETTRSSSAETDMSQQPAPYLPTSWSTPSLPTQTYLRPAAPITPYVNKPTNAYVSSSPITPAYHTPFPTPPLFQMPFMSAPTSLPAQPPYYSPSPLGQSTSTSPTLAPEMSLPQHKEHLVGLGIGVPEVPTEYYQTPTPTLSSDEYFSPPMQF
ncbi:hypothetical protein I317_01295 [Kwoniella heveanensis CBS 569]|nr:hypothetical protein I317_01295 [Kwoniella heveanensis CBS 569]